MNNDLMLKPGRNTCHGVKFPSLAARLAHTKMRAAEATWQRRGLTWAQFLHEHVQMFGDFAAHMGWNRKDAKR
jgi:hypothetical protein